MSLDFDYFDLYLGDLYKYVYKINYDPYASFSEQTRLICVKKNALLLRIEYGSYIDISNLKIRILMKIQGDNFHYSEYAIKSDDFRPFVGEVFATNIVRKDNLSLSRRRNNY